MRESAEHNAPTWPEAMARACPACNHAFPLIGVRADGGLIFRCFTHRWFSADSWSSPTAVVDTHHNDHRPLPQALRREFIGGALGILLRGGRDSGDLVLQSTTPDHSIFFGLLPGGDGGLITAVSSRQHPCVVCDVRPLAEPQERVLLDLGFASVAPGENYESLDQPTDPVRLMLMAETVFRRAFEEPADFGLSAVFNQPALAEAFYLAWSYRS